MDEAGERAIDVQVTRLRRKIEADPREPRFLHTVRGRGYVLKPGADAMRAPVRLGIGAPAQAVRCRARCSGAAC